MSEWVKESRPGSMWGRQALSPMTRPNVEQVIQVVTCVTVHNWIILNSLIKKYVQRMKMLNACCWVACQQEGATHNFGFNTVRYHWGIRTHKYNNVDLPGVRHSYLLVCPGVAVPSLVGNTPMVTIELRLYVTQILVLCVASIVIVFQWSSAWLE